MLLIAKIDLGKPDLKITPPNRAFQDFLKFFFRQKTTVTQQSLEKF